ncbi:uncharacterized protein MONOS_17440 [Monocercomonoides exilis]|nr:hypothetical protein MONOS_17440 [Monocercomonoides exilis]
MMGIENGDFLKLIPLALFFREKPIIGYVVGTNRGLDYYLCGDYDFPCPSLKYAGAAVFGSSKAVLRLMDTP